MNKVNSYGLNLQSKCGFLRKTKKLFEYHPTSIKTHKEVAQATFIHKYINIYVGKIEEGLLKL